MSERLETLKKARARMIEERNVHAKVLAAPLTGTRPSGHATSSSRFRCWSTRWIAPSVERKSFCRKAEPRRQGGAASIKMAIRGRRAHSCAMRVFRLRRTNFLVQALDPTVGDECRL